jgi:hypothetical protein
MKSSDLTYLAVYSHKNWELLGFATLHKTCQWIGAIVEERDGSETWITTLKLCKKNDGWGDSDPSPEYYEKYPWVVIAVGHDDEHYYSRFETEEKARSFANEYIFDKKELSLSDKSIWFWQN